MDALQSFVITDEDLLPLHLKHRSPSSRLKNVTAVYKQALDQICDAADGRVTWAGAIEFQASITSGMLTDFCDPHEIHAAGMRTTHRFRVVYAPEIQRGVKETPA